MELLFLADACRRAGAARLTAVVPYFGYARQDRRRVRPGSRWRAVIAGLIEAAGFARVVAIDLHAPEIEGFFHIPLEHLSAAKLLAEAVRTTSDTVIVAPDLGAVKLAERYQALLHLPVVSCTRRGSAVPRCRCAASSATSRIGRPDRRRHDYNGRHHRGGRQGPARSRL